MSDIKFGTDGWRGMIAEDYTFDNLRRCSQGFATYLLENGGRENGAVIGYDQRFHSENFAKAAAEVLAANGIRVKLTEQATPTPVISFSIKHTESAGGINLTASHNPPTDAGFKVRDSSGAAIAPADLKIIEGNIPPISDVKRMKYDDAVSDGLVEVFDAFAGYTDNLHTLIDVEPIKAAGLNVLVEPMWGNGIGWFPRLLDGGSTKVSEIHNVRNPIFPEMWRPEPIPPNVDVALAKTVEMGADVLLITDGDADRVGAGTEAGVFINQLQMYALLALYLLEIRGQRGPIVKTLSTTTMLQKLAKQYDGVPVYETGVGFKYVAPKMLEVDAMIGGEESGGFAFRGNVAERDGILAGLYLLDLMVQTSKKPSELLDYLFEKVGPHYYKRVDTRIDPEEKEQIRANVDNASPTTIGGMKVTGIDKTDGYKFNLDDGGWLLIRFSGTEPLVRVYTETTDESKVDDIIQNGLDIGGIQ